MLAGPLLRHCQRPPRKLPAWPLMGTTRLHGPSLEPPYNSVTPHIFRGALAQGPGAATGPLAVALALSLRTPEGEAKACQLHVRL